MALQRKSCHGSALSRGIGSAGGSFPDRAYSGGCSGIGHDVVHRMVAESRRDISGHLNLAPDKPDSRVASTLNWSISLAEFAR
jgi:hypothetical protein